MIHLDVDKMLYPKARNCWHQEEDKKPWNTFKKQLKSLLEWYNRLSRYSITCTFHLHHSLIQCVIGAQRKAYSTYHCTLWSRCTIDISGQHQKGGCCSHRGFWFTCIWMSYRVLQDECIWSWSDDSSRKPGKRYRDWHQGMELDKDSTHVYSLWLWLFAIVTWYWLEECT